MNPNPIEFDGIKAAPIVIADWVAGVSIHTRHYGHGETYAVIVHQSEVNDKWYVLFSFGLCESKASEELEAKSFPTPESAKSAVDTFLAAQPNVLACGVQRKEMS